MLSSCRYTLFGNENYNVRNIYDSDGNVDHGTRTLKSKTVSAPMCDGVMEPLPTSTNNSSSTSASATAQLMANFEARACDRSLLSRSH